MLNRLVRKLTDCFSPLPVPPPPEREVMLWTGDGMSPAGPDLIGKTVDFHGRKGVVVDTTALTVTVEWERCPLS